MLQIIHFWKLLAISNQKTNVAICTDIKMAAISGFQKWLPENAYSCIYLLLNKIKLCKQALNTHFKGQGCGEANQNAEHILQHCPEYQEKRKQIWTTEVPMEKKLYGNREDLQKNS